MFKWIKMSTNSRKLNYLLIPSKHNSLGSLNRLKLLWTEQYKSKNGKTLALHCHVKITSFLLLFLGDQNMTCAANTIYFYFFFYKIFPLSAVFWRKLNIQYLYRIYQNKYSLFCHCSTSQVYKIIVHKHIISQHNDMLEKLEKCFEVKCLTILLDQN